MKKLPSPPRWREGAEFRSGTVIHRHASNASRASPNKSPVRSEGNSGPEIRLVRNLYAVRISASYLRPFPWSAEPKA
jgi:hypothetical protein